MSRVGKQRLAIPDTTTVTIVDGLVTVKGPLGELSRSFKSDIGIAIEGNEVVLTPAKDSNEFYPLWGTYASHIKNMIAGVTKLYEKKLILEGVGYRAELQNGLSAGQAGKLVMQLGFSHPVTLDVPAGINLTVEKGNLTITGIDKELVGQFAAKVRDQKKPEPYKGKGMRYSDEVIRRKEGKRAA
jgi:large subunit ribosomal protein L6